MNSNMTKYIDYINNIKGNLLFGCDGFVDETYAIVDVRESLTQFTAMDKLKDFGELLVERADGGVGLEIVPKRRCEGGFAINTGRIAGILGLNVKLPGLFGKSETDPAFAGFSEYCDLLSMGDPALTLVFEFGDGKVLMSDLQAVSNLTWADFEKHFTKEQMKKMFSGVDILGLGYWSLTADFDGVFKGFIDQYETITAPRRMFFDFADIKKKSNESFIKSLELISSYNSRIPMSLSLNEHEVFELFSRVDVECSEETPAAISSALSIARKKIGFDELIVHTREFAVASNATDGEAYAMQERQSNVIRSAGAGDSFNGGYISASLGNLPIKERLVIANAATAFFVMNATGPTREELIEQIEKAADK